MKANGQFCFVTSRRIILAVCLSAIFSNILLAKDGKNRMSRTILNSYSRLDSAGAGRTVKVLKAASIAAPAAAKSAAEGSLADRTSIHFVPTSYSYPTNSKKETGVKDYDKSELIVYALAIRRYAKQYGYDTSYAFLANMGMGSTQKRFFIVNLKTLEIENSGLVSHGFGSTASFYDRQYSNKPGSKCTSLGKYSIVGEYNGSYGFSYKLKGLDSSNSNAMKRKIVIHSMTCIPDKEGNAPACVSEGCPAVSKLFLAAIQKIVESQKKPVLLWVFDSNLEKPVVELPVALIERLKYFERW